MEVMLAIIIGGVVIGLTFIIYHQQLLLNEVNKRLLLMAIEAKTQEKVTYEEVIERLLSRENVQNQFLAPSTPNRYEEEEDETINPFNLFGENE